MAEKLVPLLVVSNTFAFAFRSWAADLAMTALGLYALAKGTQLGFNGPPADAWVFGMAFAGFVIKVFNWRYFIKPENLARKGDEKAAAARSSFRAHSVLGSTAATSIANRALALCARIWDAFDMVLSGRGVGWKFELRGLAQAPSQGIGRTRFAIEQLWAVIWRYLVMDVTRYFLLSTELAGSYPLRGPMDYSFIFQVLLGALLWQWVKWKMDMPYRVASAFGVLIGWGEPKDWPPYFGSWSESWTIRRLWAKSWHQSLRLQTEPPTAWVVDKVLQARRGSFLSKYGRVVGIFFMACVVHLYGRVLAGGDVMVDWKYFMSQPLLIAFEDGFQYLVFQGGLITPDWRGSIWVGYVWVFVVQSWTLAYWMDEIVRKGLFADPVFGFSVMQPITPS